MTRTTLYSRSPRPSEPALQGVARHVGGASGAENSTAGQAGHSNDAALEPTSKPQPAWRARLMRHERWAWLALALVLATLAGWPAWRQSLPAMYTLEQLDAALRESFAKEPLPSATAAAYAAVIPSLVRVIGEVDAKTPEPVDGKAPKGSKAAKGPKAPQALPNPDVVPHDLDDADKGRSVGTGVVIVNSGLILTNLHVVRGADRIRVTFADGSESVARVVNVQPENDLAVLQALTLPDDLQAATLRSTQGLQSGDAVVAVGFPFGIGPSASAGVISGLKREFRSPKGQRILTNLIQFDAAANPGNSGGPLVTLDGHVVGIVTAIMNPEGHSTFIGIGFAVPIENAASAVGMPPF